MKIPFFEGGVEIHTPLVLKGLNAHYQRLMIFDIHCNLLYIARRSQSKSNVKETLLRHSSRTLYTKLSKQNPQTMQAFILG